MVIHTIGQKWLLTNEKSFLLEKTQELSVFPHPHAFTALYRAIIHQDPLNKRGPPAFVPFRVPYSGNEVFGDCSERKEPENYGDWICTLVGFLKSPPLVFYNSDTVQTARLTHFGEFIFPYLMKAFTALYRQNDILKQAVADYQSFKK